MPSSVSFSGASLQLQSVTPLNAGATLLVRFTNEPLQTNPAGANDALNPLNYTLTGPTTIPVVSCATVSGDPQSIYLVLAAPLTSGSWTLTAANIQTPGASPLVAPFSISFTWTAVQSGQVNPGSGNDGAEEIIRKHLSPGIAQWEKGWSSLIAALAVGDDINHDLAPKVFDQLYVSTSSGIYLDRRASDRGVLRPEDVGIGDEIFRRLTIKTTTKKVVTQAILEILEVYYGTDSTRAHLTSDLAEPFNIQDGWTLTLSINGEDEVTVPFVAADFAQMSQAKAAEVAAVITRWLKTNGSQAYAIEFIDPDTGSKRVVIYSGALGLESSVQVTGGRAQNVLQFPSLLTRSVVANNWAVTKPSPGRARYKVTGATTTDLTLVHEGDYVNVFGNNFAAANQGTFEVVKVDVRYVGGVLEQYFEVLNDTPTLQNPVAILTTSDMMFFRSTRTTINDNGARAVIVAQTNPRQIQVQLPATTIAVTRTAKSAAYLPTVATLTPSSMVRKLDGTVEVATTANHGLSIGSQVFIRGVKPSGAAPATVAGNGTSTLDASLVTIWADTAAPAGVAHRDAEVVVLNTGALLLTGGLTITPSVSTTVNHFAITGSAVLGGGQTQYSYAWTTKAVLPVARYGHRTTLLTDSLQAGNVLLTGGRNLAGTPIATGYIYNVAGDAWSASMPMVVARADHQNVMLNSGQVLVIGGRSPIAGTQTATCELYTSVGASGSFAATGSMTTARYKAAAFRLANGKVLVAGGFTFAGDTLPTDTCELYDPATALWTQAARMTYARGAAVVVPLGNDCFMVVGGRGYVARHGGAEQDLSSCEYYDGRSGRWYPALPMAKPRGNPRVAVLADRAVVMTGDAQPEYFDLATRQWNKIRTVNDGVRDGASVAAVSGLPFMYGGVNSGPSMMSYAQVQVRASDRISAGGLQEVRRVTAIPAPNVFRFSTPETLAYTSNAGTSTEINPFAAAASPANIPGPYILDPFDGVAITETKSVLTAAINKGSQYATLKLTPGTASNFPDEPGWIALAFGTEKQVGPVKYLGRANTDELLIDYAQQFTVSLPVGTTVTLLGQKGPFNPDLPQQLGVFYVTGSSAGRVAAAASIDSVVAAGIEVDKTIVYPGDRGLGGEGLPTENAQKLSDIVGVFAGDDVDEEVADSREGI